MILDAIRASGGCAIAVPEAEIDPWMRTSMAMEGIAICPETAACIAALAELKTRGWVGAKERVVVFNTGAAQKYVEALEAPLPEVSLGAPIDWARFQADMR